ncbi:MAG: helix-turn-helix domain-containing protein [Bacteroidota bacterium]
MCKEREKSEKKFFFAGDLWKWRIILLPKKKQNPASAYPEAGFENLSHFSNAFKKFFGYTPSSLKQGSAI